MFGCMSAVHGGVPADGFSLQQHCLLHGRLKLFIQPGSLSPGQDNLPLLFWLAHMEAQSSRWLMPSPMFPQLRHNRNTTSRFFLVLIG